MSRNYRINRNIVECKVVCAASSTARIHGINRNIVECKGRPDPKLASIAPVLIET